MSKIIPRAYAVCIDLHSGGAELFTRVGFPSFLATLKKSLAYYADNSPVKSVTAYALCVLCEGEGRITTPRSTKVCPTCRGKSSSLPFDVLPFLS